MIFVFISYAPHKDMISEKQQRNGFKYYNEGRLLEAADLRFSMS